jgi:hypothetical protein
MPSFSRTVIQVANNAGPLGPGTYTDASGGQVKLANRTFVAAQELGRLADFAAELQVTAGSGGSITVTLQDSWDGISWNPWVTFTAVTGVLTNPGQSQGITRNPGALVRAQAVVAAGGANYSYKLLLCGTERVS